MVGGAGAAALAAIVSCKETRNRASLQAKRSVHPSRTRGNRPYTENTEQPPAGLSVAETIESKEQRLQKLRERQQALLDKAKAVQKRIERAESAQKAKTKKSDDRTKLLIGVAVLELAKTNPTLQKMIRDSVRVLKPQEQTFLTEQSGLWGKFEELSKEAAPTAQNSRFLDMENPNDRPVRASHDEIATHVDRAIHNNAQKP